MQKLIQKLMLLPLALVFGLAILSTPANAAQDGWLPNKFDKSEHVYIDPALANDPVHPVRLDGLNEDLAKLGQSQGAQFYFVMTQKGQDVPPGNRNYADYKLDELVARWQGKPGFPAGDYVVILLVRSDRNPNAFSYSANGGSQMQIYGFTAQWFSAPGGLLKHSRDTYLPNDPAGYARAVAGGINDQIVAYKADVQKRADEAARKAQEEKAHQEFMAKLPGRIALGFLLFGLLGGTLVLVIRFRRAKSAADAKIAQWAPEMDSVNELYLKLQHGYLDFLSDQKGRKSKFKGKTLSDYVAALAAYSDFSVRRQLANELLDKARKAAAGCKFPATGGFNRAVALLTSEPVVVTGEEIALKDITDVFGGTVKKETYDPAQLLDNINDLFNSTNKAMAGIVKSFEGAAQNRKDIEGILADIDQLQAELAANGLTFDPYQQHYTGFKAEVETCLADIASNPVEVLADSDRLEDNVRALKETLKRAVALKKSLADTAECIQAATKKATDLRAQPVSFSYPLTPGEPVAASLSEARFILSEQDGNPDKLLAEASLHLSNAQAAVLAGELDKADSDKSAAETVGKQAVFLVSTILQAKGFVEQNVPPVRANLTRLADELPGAQEAVDTLNADFLKANFADEPVHLATAKKTAETTEGQLAAVRTAYFEQRFLAARKLLENVGTGVQTSRDGLVAIHTRLAQLRELRSHSKETTAAATQLSAQLVSKRADNSFTTAAATDETHEALKPKLATLSADVAKDVTDWPVTASLADEVLSALQRVSQAIDDQRQAHNLARSRVAEVATSVSTAQADCNHNDVRQAAHNKLAEAEASLKQLESNLAQAKSDWAAIARDADNKKALAGAASKLAATDKEEAATARQAMARADQKMNGADRSYQQSQSIGGSYQTFGGGIRADLSSAAGEYAAAETALRQKRYEDASAHANAAFNAAEAAEEVAAAEVAQMIATAVAIWEAEQARLRRLEEERQAEIRRQQEQEEREERQAREAREAASRSNDDDVFGRSGGGQDNDSVVGNSGGGQDENF